MGQVAGAFCALRVPVSFGLHKFGRVDNDEFTQILHGFTIKMDETPKFGLWENLFSQP